VPASEKGVICLKIKRKTIAYLAVDILLSFAAYSTVYMLFGARFFPSDYGKVALIGLIIGICNLLGFIGAGVYRRLWRYASFNDLSYIIWGVFLGQALGYLMAYLIVPWLVPLRIMVTQALMFFLLAVAMRGLVRSLYEEMHSIKTHADWIGKRVLIIGAGSAGVMVAREIKTAMRGQYNAIGFIDDDPAKLNCWIYGIKVLGSFKELPDLVSKYKIEELIIAIPRAEKSVIKKIAALSLPASVRMKVIPGINDLISGRVDVKRFRDVQVEDLLGRAPIVTDLHSVAAYLKGKKVLITGAGGSIGSELCRQVAHFAPEALIMLGRGENSIYEIELECRELFPNLQIHSVIRDIRDRAAINKFFDDYKPQVVFHAAAHKHVPLMEKCPEEAFKNNVLGTKNLAEAAAAHHCELFVMISTDKAIRPTSVMGATKRLAEMIVNKLNDTSDTKFVSVRFGNVLGSRGSVVPLFRRQIAKGGPITITHPDMQRYFMTIPEAVQLVIQAGALGHGGEVFILDMGEPVRIVELAENLIRLSGLTVGQDIKIVYSGIRAGEKLYEELLSPEEIKSTTKHERIFVADVPNGIGDDFFKELETMRLQLDKGDTSGVMDFIRKWVTDYRPPTNEAIAAANEAAAAATDEATAAATATATDNAEAAVTTDNN